MYIAIAFMNIRIGLIFLEESNCRNDCPVSSGHVIQVFVSYNHSGRTSAITINSSYTASSFHSLCQFC